MSAGLYTIAVVIDLEGQYDEAFFELVVIRLNVHEIEEESVVKTHHLNEIFVNRLTKRFDGDKRLKPRVTNTNAEKAFNLQTALSFDKLH